MKKQTKATMYALAAVLLWSTAASAFKLTLRRMTSLHMLLWASGVSLAALFVIVLVQGKLPCLAAYSRKDYFRSMLLGFLNPFLYYVILFKAYSILTAQEALTLNYTWPIMLVVLSVPLLGQPLTLRSVAALFISFSGVVVIATGGDVFGLRFTAPFGVVLALGSSVVWALFWIFNVRDDRDEVLKLFLNFVFGTLYVLTATAVSSALTMPVPHGFLGSAYIGLFEMGITFVLWLKALSLSESTARVGVFIFASPFLSLVFIHFVVGEPVEPSTVAGLVFIVAGIMLQRSEGEKERMVPVPAARTKGGGSRP